MTSPTTAKPTAVSHRRSYSTAQRCHILSTLGWRDRNPPVRRRERDPSGGTLRGPGHFHQGVPMLDLLQNANLAVRLGVEVALLVAVGYAAWRGISHRTLRLVAVFALPLSVAVLWVTVVHGSGVPAPLRGGAQIALFTAAATGLVLVRRARLATGFAVVALANASLMAIWAQ